MIANDSYDLLPKRTAELVQVVGFKTAMTLVNQFGGTHLNIPKTAKPRHKLLAFISFDDFQKLCQYYGGTPLEIDLCAHIINRQKKQLIMADIEAGMTNATVARKYETTERNIRRIKQQARFMTQYNLDIFELT